MPGELLEILCQGDPLLLGDRMFLNVQQASLGALDINSFHIPNTHTAGQGSASSLGQGCHETVLSYFQRALEASVTEAIPKIF